MKSTKWSLEMIQPITLLMIWIQQATIPSILWLICLWEPVRCQIMWLSTPLKMVRQINTTHFKWAFLFALSRKVQSSANISRGSSDISETSGYMQSKTELANERNENKVTFWQDSIMYYMVSFFTLKDVSLNQVSNYSRSLRTSSVLRMCWKPRILNCTPSASSGNFEGKFGITIWHTKKIKVVVFDVHVGMVSVLVSGIWVS